MFPLGSSQLLAMLSSFLFTLVAFFDGNWDLITDENIISKQHALFEISRIPVEENILNV